MSEEIFLTGRILVGGYFVMMGVNHFLKMEAMTEYAKSKNAPLPKISVIGTGVGMFLAGLGIIINQYMFASLLVLILFLLSASFVMHRFWSIADQSQKMQEMVNFTKNIGLIGALALYISTLV